MSQKNNKGVAFFEGSSWFHRIKLLQPDGTGSYSKRGGFQTEAEAEASYYKCEEECKKASRNLQLSKKINTEIGLKDYLLYWFEDVFSERVEKSTRLICGYTLYDLILRNMEHDVTLRFANVDYFDALLAVVAKSCESA